MDDSGRQWMRLVCARQQQDEHKELASVQASHVSEKQVAGQASPQVHPVQSQPLSSSWEQVASFSRTQ